jgi:hypothetical protein
MARMSKKNDSGMVSPKTMSSVGNHSTMAVSEPGSSRTTAKVVPVGKAAGTPCLTHQQIEQRAREIWQQKGRPVGQDEKIWLEAETQLKKELGIK